MLSKIKQIILKLAFSSILKTKGAKKMLEKLGKALEGKKTIILIIVAIISGLAQAFFGLSLPTEFWTTLLGLIGITAKEGFNRTEQQTKETAEQIKALLEAIKKQKAEK